MFWQQIILDCSQGDKFILCYVNTISLIFSRYLTNVKWYKCSAIHRVNATICLANFISKSLTLLSPHFGAFKIHKKRFHSIHRHRARVQHLANRFNISYWFICKYERTTKPTSVARLLISNTWWFNVIRDLI